MNFDPITALPLFVIVVIGVAAMFGLWRLFGITGLVSGLVGLLALIVYRDGREKARTDIIEKGKRDAERVVRKADDARVRADVRNADPDELRKSDGFRRD